MWLFTRSSFLSIVEDPSDARYFIPRARVAGDLEATFPGCLVDQSTSTDYRYRTWLRREAVVDAVAAAVRGIDYENFKSSVEDRRRSTWYSAVWSAGIDAQERRLNEKPDRPKRR
jgi:hypothetical protein